MMARTDRTIRFQGKARMVLRLAVIGLIAFAAITFFATNLQILDIRFIIATRHFHTALANLGLSSTFYVLWLPGLQAIAVLLNVILALIIVSRRSSEPVALLTAVALVVFSSINLHNNDQIALRFPVLLVLQAVNWFIALTAINLSIILFPDGRPYPRWVIGLVIPNLLIHAAVIGYVLNSDTSSPGALMAYAAALLTGSIALAAQLVRYRRVLNPLQRQQVKWILGGMALSTLTLIVYFTTFAIVAPRIPEDSTHRLLLDLIVDDGLHFLAIIIVALSMMNAILRRRLWDIDFAVNRALGFGAALLVSAIVFAVVAILLNILLSLSVTLLFSSALAVGVFIPVRPAVQRLIDTRVYGLRQPVEAYEPITPPVPQPPVSKPSMYTGKLLDGIELRDLIARGGMGEVYKGYAENALYAVKILPTDHDEEAAIRFGQEAEAMRRIQHPNIVRLQQFGSADGIHYLAMDYIEGIPLRTYIIQRRCMPVNEVFGIIDDLVSALDHIHAKGIIHRDLKPGNIMLNLDAAGMPTRAVLLDFGIARIVEMSITQTGMGNVGTVEYIAPEQILSSRTVTQAADIYSLGVIVYEMLTGERPFKGNAGQVLFGHLKQPAPDPRDLVETIPMEVSFAVRRAMAKEPEDRYDSARAFAAALRDTESATSASIRLY